MLVQSKLTDNVTNHLSCQRPFPIYLDNQPAKHRGTSSGREGPHTILSGRRNKWHRYTTTHIKLYSIHVIQIPLISCVIDLLTCLVTSSLPPDNRFLPNIPQHNAKLFRSLLGLLLLCRYYTEMRYHSHFLLWV